MEKQHGLLSIVLILFLGLSEACQRADVNRSMNFGISEDKIDVPTGKCDYTDINGRRNSLSLILPRTCAPRRLYPGFIANNYLTCLSLRNNLIDSIPRGSFDRLPNLYYLDLSKNRIQFTDLLSFGGHSSLTTLIADGNGDNVINDRGLTIDRADIFPRLKHLYLRNNFLRHVRISFCRIFPVLTHLYLSDNLLTSESLNDLRNLPISLSHLHLERNGIRRVESQMIRNVGHLFLDGNAIGRVCSTGCTDNCLNLRGATKLLFLSLSRNEIASMDVDAFVDLSNLRSLNLAHNRIETIATGTLDRLLRLEDLSLSHNRLRILPDFNSVGTLVSLALDQNYIEKILSGGFANLARLKRLSLTGNHLRIIEQRAFQNLPMLEELDLSDNELDYLPPKWIDCATPLRLLDLRGNRFINYDHLYLRDLISPIELYVGGNPLANFPQSEINTYTSKVSIHTQYSETFGTRPCHVMCSFNNHFVQNHDYVV